MEGLVKRDLYCMRKIIKLFLGVTAGVILLSFLFVLSTEYGNLNPEKVHALAETREEMDELISLMQLGVMFILMVPLAFIANITDCFKEDYRADFHKFLFTMPVKYSVIVGSRYVTCLAFVGVSFLGSTLAAVLVSMVSELYEFETLFSVISVAASFFILYAALELILLYSFGSSHADIIQIVPFLVFFVVLYILFASKIMSMSEQEMDNLFGSAIVILTKVKKFVTEKYILFLLGSLVALALSYVGSVFIMGRKAGKKL